MVQLCALLCMVPLALENTVLQAHLANLALMDIFVALAAHEGQVDLQAKGLVALGVLGQVIVKILNRSVQSLLGR